MVFKIENIKGKKVIKNIENKGNITLKNIDELLCLIKEQINKNEDIYFDFSNIEYIDSTGLGALIKLMRDLKENNKDIGIISIREDVMLVFEHTKVIEFFKFYNNIEDIKS